MTDNITLPREVARLALSYIEWYIENEDGGRFVQVREAEAILRTALAAEQPKPLTDEEALRLWAGDVPRPVIGKNKVLAFTRAIERAHNIKGDKT